VYVNKTSLSILFLDWTLGAIAIGFFKPNGWRLATNTNQTMAQDSGQPFLAWAFMEATHLGCSQAATLAQSVEGADIRFVF